MTIIAYHQGVLYADDQGRAPANSFSVAVSSQKIQTSKCKRFAFAFSGTMPEGARADWMESYLLKHLMDFYGDTDLMIPSIGSEGYAKPIRDHMVLMTKDNAWYCVPDQKEDGVILLPAAQEAPVCLGSGQDVVMTLWALGWDTERAVKRAHHYVSTCSGNISKVTQKSLKPFKIAGVTCG